jgi:chromosome segregation ATPase
MSSNNTPSASTCSTSFELQAKADEWIDVTPTEEVLRTELTRLQEAFEKCTIQLDSSRLENNLLRDRGTALEHETETLQSLLDTTHSDLESTQTELTSLETSSEQDIEVLEALLTSTTEKQARSEKDANSLEKQLSATNQEHASEAARQTAVLQRLERELKASKAETRTHKDAAIRFAEDLRTAWDNHKSTKRTLEETKKLLSKEENLHSKAKQTIGTIATLAETLKGDNQGLKRNLARENRLRSEAESLVDNLRKQQADTKALHDKTILTLQSYFSKRTKDLKASNASLEILQTELKDAEKSLKESSVETISLKAHLATMESGRHELLERQSELEISVEEANDDRETAHQELVSAKVTLETALLERDTLRNQRSTYVLSSEQEAELEAKLIEQRTAFEDRLRKIHAILGLKFTTAFQSEVRTIHKTAIKQMPKSFKVPLLLHQQYVKSW